MFSTFCRSSGCFSTFDYQLALEEAIDFPVQTIERYTPLAGKHGCICNYEMRDLHIHDLRRTLGS